MDPNKVHYGSLSLGSELTSSEVSQESYLQLITHALTSARDFIVGGLRDLLGFLGSALSLVDPLIVSLSSNLINFIVNLYGLFQQGLSTVYRVLLTSSLITSFISFINGVGSILANTDFAWNADKAVSVARGFVTQMIPSFFPSVFSNSDEGKESTPPEATPMTIQAWIKLGIAGIISVLLGGIGLTSDATMLQATQGLNFINAAGRTHSTVQGVAEFILREVVGLEVDSDYAAIKELEALVSEGSFLQSCSSAHFVQHPGDFVKLQKFSAKIVQITSRPISKDASVRYNSTRSLLVQMYRVLSDKLASVNAILETKQRQATQAILFSGRPGVGKSELCKYMSKQIGKVLNYNPAIYTLNKKSDGFFEPYGGQSFGVFNEWMALMSEDPLLKDFNLIFSSDPMNFEGAALDCKNQPNRLKLAFLTSNAENPDLTRVMNPDAAMAVWDRIYHVRVVDPKCRGRGAPNPHRRPDFSHLEFVKVDHGNLNCWDSGTVSMKTLLNRCIGRCAAAEVDFLRNLLEDEGIETSMREKLLARTSELEVILESNNPYDCQPVVANGWGREFFTFRFQGMPGSGKTTLCEQVAREFSTLFGYDVQYSLDICQFQPVEDKPVIYVMDDWVEQAADMGRYLSMINQTHRLSIFLICSNTVYQRMAPPWSLAEAKETAYAWWKGFKRLQPYDARHFSGPTGVLRRLGLEGDVMLPDNQLISQNVAFSKTFTFNEYFTVRSATGMVVTRQYIMNELFNCYRKFLRQPGDMLIMRSPPTSVSQPEVRITAEDEKILLEVLKSPELMFKAFLGRHEKVKFELSDSLVDRATSPQTSIRMWHVPADTVVTPEALMDLFVRMSILYERIAPSASLEVRILQGDTIYYYENHVIYHFSNKSNLNLSLVSECDDALVINVAGVKRVVSLDECYALYVRKELGSVLTDLDLQHCLAVSSYIHNVIADSTNFSSFKLRFLERKQDLERNQNSRGRRILVSMSKHPMFWIACSLVVFSAMGATIYKLINLCFDAVLPSRPSDREENIKILKSLYPDDDYSGYSDDWIRKHALTVKDQHLLPSHVNSTAISFRKLIPVCPNEDTFGNTKLRQYNKLRVNEDTFGNDRKMLARRIRVNERAVGALEKRVGPIPRGLIESEALRYSDDLSVSDPVMDSLTQHDCDDPFVETAAARKVGLRPTPGYKLSQLVASNMVTYEEEIEQAKTPLESLVPSFQKAYFLLINKRGGRCYGIGMQGRLILSVSHMFDDVWERVIVQSDGNQYEAQCVSIYRDRDLAVIYVTDKTFGSIKSTSRLFADSDVVDDPLYGFFMRPIAGASCIGGFLCYTSALAFPMTDRMNGNFKLSEKVYTFSAIAMNRVRDFVKKGDCGFPLVVPDGQGSYRIAGIHNSYAEQEKVFFSAVTYGDFVEFCKTALDRISNGVGGDSSMVLMDIPSIPCEFLIPEPYADAITRAQGVQTPFDDQSDRLAIIGYSDDLAIRSRPKLNVRHVDLPGMQCPVSKIPAAFCMDFVDDPSDLVYDVRGRPDPLFTQCVKYDNRVSTNFDPDVLSEAASLVIDDISLRYGGARWLRYHEVLNGTECGSIGPFDPTTSGGPFLKMMFGIHSKVPLFKVSSNPNRRIFLMDLDNPAALTVRKHYEQYVRSLMNGGAPPIVISKDCAKVELIDAVKASRGKVRLFNEIDFSINMVLKKMFGDMQAKVISTHLDNPIMMGMNPYKAMTTLWNRFASLDGKVISTDFSGFDKQIPAVLIYIFCRCAAECYKEQPDYSYEEIVHIYEQLFYTLTYSIHTCRGTLYMVDRGNESGSFVTTILNSIAVRTLSMYTLVRKWRIIFRFKPSLKELLSVYHEAIYGDDRTIKVAPCLPVEPGDFMDDSVLFGLKCTPAKTSGIIDFCSRSLYFDDRSGVCFPALKESSIFSQVRWIKSMTRGQVIDSLDNALFEAALHQDAAVFDMVLSDSIILCKHLDIKPTSISFSNRSVIRHRFVSYVRDDDESAWLTYHASRDVQDTSSYFDAVDSHRRALVFKKELLSVSDTSADNPNLVRIKLKCLARRLNEPLTIVMANPDTNPVSAVLEALTACKISEKPLENYGTEKGEFFCELALLGQTTRGCAPNKKGAKFQAYKQMYAVIKATSLLRPTTTTANAIRGARDDAQKYSKDYLYGAIKNHLSVAKRIYEFIQRPVCVLTERLPINSEDRLVGTLRYQEEDGIAYALSKTSQDIGPRKMWNLYLAQAGTLDTGCKIFVGDTAVSSNMDPGTHTSGNLVGDTMTNPGITTIPSLPNVVSVTETAPAVVDNAPPSMAAFEPMMPQMNLNPAGPPNMLSAGAIGFDIKDLAYNQFMDCDTMQTFSDASMDGAILFQIPYDPLSQWMNRYAQAYIRLHQRYAGDLMYRFTVVGNQTFSGFIGLCWYPEKYTGTRMALSEAMKYNYVAESINQPFSCIFRLGDARQDKFWRSTADTSDVDKRPHLVCFVMLTAVSALREGITIRIRVASKLSQGFQVSNPVLTPAMGALPSASVHGADVRQFLGQSLMPAIVRPNQLGTTSPFHLVIDGSTFIPTVRGVVGDYIISNIPLPTGIAYRSISGDAACVNNRISLRSTYVSMNSDKVKFDRFLTVDFSRSPNLVMNEDISTFLMDFFRKYPSAGDDAISNGIAEKIGSSYNLKFNSAGFVKYSWRADGAKAVEATTSVWSLYCLVTPHGPVFVWYVKVAEGEDLTWGSTDDLCVNKSMEIVSATVTQVTNVWYKVSAEAMPAGWRHLAITPDVPFVLSKGSVASHVPSHESLLSLISYLKLDIKQSQCLQMTLADYDSMRDIATIRYIPDRKIAVINVGDDPIMFATSLRGCENMFVSEVAIVEKSTVFPVTKISGNFAENQVSLQVEQREFKPLPLNPVFRGQPRTILSRTG